MARVFISYAREDIAAAQVLADVLERAQHKVWWDHHLRAGSRFSWDIAAALGGADVVIVLWSKNSIESAWVQDEAAEGLEGSRLIPVALDGSKPPLGFRQYHTIGLSGSRGSAADLKAVLLAVEAKASGTPISSPPPQSPDAAPVRPTICVMPFENKSGDRDQDYFSDGVTEDVLTDLARISALSVISHRATALFRRQAIDLQQLANELGVTHVVEGSVRKSGSRVRITAQLIESATGCSVWAERFERQLDDVFVIQDEISHAIIHALELKLLPDEKSAIVEGRTTNADAYDLYLKARALWPAGATGDYRNNQEIVRLCTEATALDPKYANGWALMALASAELRFWQGAHVDALAMANRATQLDRQMPEPRCVRALHFEERGEQDNAQLEINTALEVDPDSWEANCTGAKLAFRRGDPAHAIPMLEKAVALGTKDHASAAMLVSCYNALGDPVGLRRAAEKAVAFAESYVICDPANGSAFASAARGFAALGERDRANKWIRKALNVDPGNLAMRYSIAATAAGLLNDTSHALEILEPFVEAARFVSHLALLEEDKSWAVLRDCAAFEAMLQRVTRRVDGLAVSC